MDQVINSLSQSIDKLTGHESSPITETISDEINNAKFDRNLNGVSIFVDEINSINQGLDSVHSDGIEDSLGSIEKDLDHVAGQINTAIKVVDAGAGSNKTAEHIRNASESLDSALEKIDNLVEFVIGNGEYSEEVLTDKPEKAQVSGLLAENDLDSIKCALENSLDKLSE